MTKKPMGFFVLFMLLLSFIYPSAALAISEEEMTYLKMYFKDEELEVVSSTRSLKSISRVAENMTVITASDIELMNAHTVADVLTTVTGVRTNIGLSSPGNVANPVIQSSNLAHVTVFMDGVPLNNLLNNTTDVGSIRVQHIAKIEIIKGPASSAWGSSLGGVINIITKSAPNDGKMGGTLSASYGERNTNDLRTEVNGRKDKFGFYVSAGRLQSDGLRPVNDVENTNLFTKLSLDTSPDTRILLSMFYAKDSRGNWQDRPWDLFGRDKYERMSSSLSLNSRLNSEVDLSVSVWASKYDSNTFWNLISDGSEYYKGYFRDSSYGTSAKLTWNHDIHSIVVGTDYDNGTTKADSVINDKQGIRKWAVYANDTIILGKFSVTPGLRYDNTDTNGDFVSPSLGLTYELLKKTILRVYVTRGFSIPPLIMTFMKNNQPGWQTNPDIKVENVWSYQAGVETGALKYVWLKLTAFRHDIKDGIVQDTIGGISMNVNKEETRRQGLEAELRTIPVFNTFLSAGTIYTESKNVLTDEEIRDVYKYTANAGLHYDDNKSFRAALQGNYTWWHSQDYHLAKYNAFVFNANLIKTLYRQKENRLDTFLTIHNIFNGSQYWDYTYPNPARWLEAGLRYKF